MVRYCYKLNTNSIHSLVRRTYRWVACCSALLFATCCCLYVTSCCHACYCLLLSIPPSAMLCLVHSNGCLCSILGAVLIWLIMYSLTALICQAAWDAHTDSSTSLDSVISPGDSWSEFALGHLPPFLVAVSSQHLHCVLLILCYYVYATN